MTSSRIATSTICLLACLTAAVPARGQSVSVPLTADAWSATDSVKSVTFLGRPALYLRRGIALANGVAIENGAIDLDMAATDTTTFLGVSFRAAAPQFSNVIFFRPGSSGTTEAIQYGPAFNTLGVAWQVYHGAGANAAVGLPRNRWIHLKLVLDGAVARLYIDSATTPTLIVPHVVMSNGSGVGVWTGPFGRGAYFADVRYTPAAAPATAVAVAPLPPGTIRDWDLSDAIESGAFTPTRLPNLGGLKWERVATEPEGFVLVNRYRQAPVSGVPRDSTGAVLTDSVMSGKVAGWRVVYARTTITANHDELRRLQYAYCNGIVIYLNGRPVAFNMNPGGLRADISPMAHVGDAVYLPLKKGRNELVYAVMNATGGWAFSARLDLPVQ